jgi:type II secretory pathway predicted ATPase ExeA
MSAGHREAVAAVVEGVLESSDSLVLIGEAGAGKTAVLDAVMAELTPAAARLVRVAASTAKPMGLQALTAQLAERSRARSGTDEDVERVFETLTVPDTDQARIVLVLDGAEALLPEALRYIQLACKAQPRLQVVFSGRPELRGHLSDGAFAFLRGRIGRTLALSALTVDEATGFIEHRLRLAGLPSAALITSDALAELLSYGHGNPGRIAAVLDRAAAAQRRRRRDDAGIDAAGEPEQAERVAARADVANERSAAPVRGAGRRRPRPPAWVLVWIGLIAEVGLGTAILAGTAPLPNDTPAQHAQLAAASTIRPVGLGAEQAGVVQVETFPVSGRQVGAAAPRAARHAMSDPPSNTPASPDVTAPSSPRWARPAPRCRRPRRLRLLVPNRPRQKAPIPHLR